MCPTLIEFATSQPLDKSSFIRYGLLTFILWGTPMIRIDHVIMKKNLLRLKSRLEILLGQIREHHHEVGEKTSMEMAHKIRQIEGIVLTLNERSHVDLGGLSDLILVVHKLRKDCHRLTAQVLQYKPTFLNK